MRKFLLGAALSLAAFPAGAEPNLQQTVTAFLNAYGSGDKAAVIAAVSPDSQFYGSDVSEIYKGVEGAADKFDADMRLWGGAARFGTMWHVTSVREGNLASIMFDVPFTAGKNATVTVRVAMVWHLEAGAWKLVQSSSTVPTVGQGAKE